MLISITKKEILKRNNYLRVEATFSTNISCFLVMGLYFLAFNLTLAFHQAGFLHNKKKNHQVYFQELI